MPVAQIVVELDDLGLKAATSGRPPQGITHHETLPPMSDAPHLHENSQTLSLSFEGRLIQSCMNRDKPTELVLDYTCAMMGALLFNPKPRHVLMIGLGGGSMLKYLHQHVPECDLTTVEISQPVIDLRGTFLIPPDDARHRIVCADGAAFLRQPPKRYDLILVDGFTGEGIVEALCSRSFYGQCRKALTAEGLLVANVHAEVNQAREIGKRLNKTFDGAVLSLPSEEGGNDVAIAGPRHVFEEARADLNRLWDGLDAAHRATLADVLPRLRTALTRDWTSRA